MQPEVAQMAVILRFGIAACALVLAFQYVLMPTLVDSFRQRLFRLRRELFLLMANGEVDRDDPAYDMLCDIMNSVLRFAERITFSRGIFAMLVFRTDVKKTVRRWEATIKEARTDAARAQFARIRSLLDRGVGMHLLATSPIMWMLLGAVIVYAMLRAVMQVLVDPMQELLWISGRAIRGIEVEAGLANDGLKLAGCQSA